MPARPKPGFAPTPCRNSDIRPLIVGDGPAADAFGALQQPVLTGHLEGEQLARAVASADVLLHTSTTETFGNVVLEGMASGLAVVNATTALIEDGRTGMLCPPDDIDCYQRAIIALAEDPDRRKALGAAARAASEAYSWTSASRSVAEAYRGLLG